MKLDEVPLESTSVVEGELCLPEEDEDDEDSEDTVEADLSEALELLDSWVTLAEGMLRRKNRKRSWMEEKELEELALETTGFLGQWENRE